jgi:hypothetical protein
MIFCHPFHQNLPLLILHRQKKNETKENNQDPIKLLFTKSPNSN